VIVHVRPTGEPRQNFSLGPGGASLAETGLRSLPVGFGGHANDAEASFATNEAKRVQCRPGWAALASTRSCAVGG